MSSSLLIFSPDFFLRDGRRLHTGKGRRRGGEGGRRGDAQIGIVSFLNSTFTTSFPLCFTGNSSRVLGPVGK